MNPSEVKDLAGGLSQQPTEAEDSLIRGTPVRAEAVLTKPGRVGTARRRGFGERDEKVYERNQCVKLRKRRADSNLADLGRSAAHIRPRGTAQSFVYTYPSKKAVRAVMGKVRTLSRLNKNLPLEVLLHRLNPVLRGWCTYFQPGVSSATFRFLRAFAWRRVIG
jgi:hypothetical protein